jgi:hypothetical protein
MRNIPIPVDTTKLTFVCVSASRPRLLDKDSGEVKVDRDGRSVYQVGLSAADESGRAELLTVRVPGNPDIVIGQIVVPVGLVGFAWEQTRNGQTRWGISYRAESISPGNPGAGSTTPPVAKAA